MTRKWRFIFFTFLSIVIIFVLKVRYDYPHKKRIRSIHPRNFTDLQDKLKWALVNKVQNVSECGCQRQYFYPPSEDHPNVFYSSCSDEGTFYQDGQKVVSISMYINKKEEHQNELRKLYSDGIRENLQKMNKYYPGYSLRLYTDEILGGEYCDFVCNYPELFWCNVKESPSLGDQSEIFYMSWRFFPLGDPTVDLFLSRDLDSVITPREVGVVQDWLKLDKAIHVMRDKAKDHDTPILGGLWGARNPLLGEDASKLREEIIELSGEEKQYKGMDQEILSKVIFYPRKNDIVAYDSYHCKYWSWYTLFRPFPTKRENSVNDFVGNPDLGRQKHQLQVCPVDCRPAYGKDWEYC